MTLPTMAEFSEQCRQVIARGEFHKAKLSDLDSWSHAIVQQFLNTDSIPWTVSMLPVGCIVKIKDDYLKYLICIPFGSYAEQDRDQFYWLIGDDPNKDEHALKPDDALVYLLRRHLQNEFAKRHGLQN